MRAMTNRIRAMITITIISYIGCLSVSSHLVLRLSQSWDGQQHRWFVDILLHCYWKLQRLVVKDPAVKRHTEIITYMENVHVTALCSSYIILFLLLLYSKHVWDWRLGLGYSVHQVQYITRKIQGEEFRTRQYQNKHVWDLHMYI